MKQNRISFSILFAAFAVFGCLKLSAAYVVSDAKVKNVMHLSNKFPELSQQAKYSKLLNGFAEYLDNSDLVCTTVAPSNKAISRTMKALGRYLGLFTQNKTMQTEIFDYHVIPGEKFPLGRLLENEVTPALTRANQTLWFVRRGDEIYASSRQDFLVPLKLVDITTGGCVTHTVDMLLIPPNLMPTFDKWMKDAGSPPMTVAREEWAPPLTPAPGAIEAPAAVPAAPAAPASASQAPKQQQTTAAPNSPQSGPNTSGAQGVELLSTRFLASVLVAAMAAAFMA